MRLSPKGILYIYYQLYLRINKFDIHSSHFLHLCYFFLIFLQNMHLNMSYKLASLAMQFPVFTKRVNTSKPIAVMLQNVLLIWV